MIHLAADRDNQCGWDSAIPNNIDASLNVFHAAAAHNVKRFVFASSNWVVGGYRFVNARLTPEITPNPVNPYGVTKLLGKEPANTLVNSLVWMLSVLVSVGRNGHTKISQALIWRWGVGGS